jgi:hypothetical protein
VEGNKVRFLPPKVWDTKAKWNYACVLGMACREKHHPAKCKTF